jgi:hypothetical protein
MPRPGEEPANLRGQRRGRGQRRDRLAQAEQRPDGPEHLGVGALEGPGHVRRNLAAELAALHVRPACFHGPRDGGLLRLVLFGCYQGHDPGLHLLPDPRHTEQRGRLHVLQRAEKSLLIRAEVDMRGLVNRHVDRQHPLRDVRERQVGDRPEFRGHGSGHMQARRLEQHIAVSGHHALGLSGGPRRVQQGHRVIGRYRSHPVGDSIRVRGVLLGAELFELRPGQVELVRRPSRRVENDDLVQPGQPPEDGLPPAQLVRAVEHGHPGRAVRRDVCHLLGREGGIERHRYGARVHGTKVGEDMFDPVGQHQRNPVTGPAADRDESRGKLERALTRLRPRQGLPFPVGAVGEGWRVTALLGRPPQVVTERPSLNQLLDLCPILKGLGCHRAPPPRGLLAGPASSLLGFIRGGSTDPAPRGSTTRRRVRSATSASRQRAWTEPARH